MQFGFALVHAFRATDPKKAAITNLSLQIVTFIAAKRLKTAKQA